jgi:hypothetical protein
MKQANSEFSVKMQGNYQVPEIKKLLPRWPQSPYQLYLIKNSLRPKDAFESWKALDEVARKPYVEESNKQKVLEKEIKLQAKKHYSLVVALNDLEAAMKSLKDQYSSLRINPKPQPRPKKNIGFEKFSNEFLNKNLKEGESLQDNHLAIKKAWNQLTKDQKSAYFNSGNN